MNVASGIWHQCWHDASPLILLHCTTCGIAPARGQSLCTANGDRKAQSPAYMGYCDTAGSLLPWGVSLGIPAACSQLTIKLVDVACLSCLDAEG